MTDNTMTTMTDNTMTDNTIKEMPTYDRAICNRTTNIILEGEVVEAIVNLEPEAYKDFLLYNCKGKAMLYVQLNKALYGTLQAALLFWKLLSNTPQEWGFIINEYDRCIANKMIDGKQCTIIWHINDLNLSHVKKAVVDNVLKKLNKKFAKKVN